MIEQRAENGEPRTLPRFDESARARRLERQLHDGPALRLAALSLRLGVCRHYTSREEQALHECLSGAQDELHEVLQELRDVANQIYPPVLATAGLGAALEALAERNGVPLTVHAPGERYDARVEAVAYFAVAEHLLPLAGQSSALTVSIQRAEDELVLTITADDNGPIAVEPTENSPASQPEQGREGVITVRVPCE